MKIEEARRILLSDADFGGIGEKARLTADALVLAIEALEKQIPKKPIKLIDWGNNRCPCCGTLYGEDGIMENYDYCPDCGQKIDWSDDE